MSAPAGSRRVVVIGAGPNGLVAAAYLARAGIAPLVLERRPVVGGIAVTEEIAPGFRAPTVAHALGPFRPAIARELSLERHGVAWLRPATRVFAPAPDGHAIRIEEDPGATARGLEPISRHDAQGYLAFHDILRRIGRVLEPLLSMTPPEIDGPALPDLWRLLGVGRRFRGLPRRDAFRLLRWGPMAVADLVSEFFETELLRAAVAARGIAGAFAGPWSAGTSVNLLLQAALETNGEPPSFFVRGGPGALTRALAAAAQNAGAEIRTGAEVARIATKNGEVTGVALSGGEEISARAVVSNADPKRTLLRLVDPVDLDPDFIRKIENYRSSGSLAKVNLALSRLPTFRAAGSGDGGATAVLSGRIHIGPDIDYLERAFDAAKYGDFSPHPTCDVVIPTIADPSLAPPGAHVMSIAAQFAPYRLKSGHWTAQRDALADAVVDAVAEHAPDIRGLVVHRHVLTPEDLETEYGLTGGHVFHGENTLDQIFTMRPILNWARYRTPIRGLYLCGSGTHPGGGVTGVPGVNASREILKDLRK